MEAFREGEGGRAGFPEASSGVVLFGRFLLKNDSIETILGGGSDQLWLGEGKGRDRNNCGRKTKSVLLP